MAEIKPFAALRYAPAMEKELARLLTPPYDVISPEMQAELYARNPHNLVRIDLAKEEAGDDERKNRYTRAAGALQAWIAEGVLARDPREAFYVYEQEFDLSGKGRRRRRGFFCAVRLEDLHEGGIRGHERTFDGPKADRLKLTRATHCNMSPIFSMYDDPAKVTDGIIEKAIAGKKKQEVTINGITHRLWVVDDPGAIESLRSQLREKQLFIADGHHRYETSLMYRDARVKEGGRQVADEPFDYTLMFITNMRAEGMEILPTHRVLGKQAGRKIDAEKMLAELRKSFDVEEVKLVSDLSVAAADVSRRLDAAGRQATSFCLIFPGDRAYLLKLRADADPNRLINNKDIAPEVKRLDVTILHQHILRVFLGDAADHLGHDDLHYVKDAAETIRMMRSSECEAAFLMNPTKMEQVSEVAGLGLRMPQKSTYFYPKIITGMVIREI